MAYTTISRATLRSRLQDRFDGTPFWSATEANDAINEALRWFNLYTGYWRGSVPVVTGVGGRFLSVGGTLTYRTRVTRAGKALARKSIVELYRQRKNWRTQSTSDGGDVPSTIQEWAPIGLSTIAIWPADGPGGTTLTIEAVKITPILSLDGSFVDLGTEELDLLLDECLWILSFKRPSLQEGFQPLHQHFLQGCLDRNDQLRASAFFREALGLDQEQRLVPPRRSADPDTLVPTAGGGR
jgi:hypothetical protein